MVPVRILCIISTIPPISPLLLTRRGVCQDMAVNVGTELCACLGTERTEVRTYTLAYYCLVLYPSSTLRPLNFFFLPQVVTSRHNKLNTSLVLSK
jgi:hypothetical protein